MLNVFDKCLNNNIFMIHFITQICKIFYAKIGLKATQAYPLVDLNTYKKNVVVDEQKNQNN